MPLESLYCTARPSTFYLHVKIVNIYQQVRFLHFNPPVFYGQFSKSFKVALHTCFTAVTGTFEIVVVGDRCSSKDRTTNITYVSYLVINLKTGGHVLAYLYKLSNTLLSLISLKSDTKSGKYYLFLSTNHS